MFGVISELCGLHAQVMSSAELTLWTRVDGIRAGDLATALWSERSLVKIWAMRGTLHVFPATEHPLWTAALRSHAQLTTERWARYFGVTSSQMDRLIVALADALDGASLTRDELAEAVTRRTRSKRYGEAMRHSWGGMLKPASYRGLLCFAPSAGQRVRFTNPRSWLGVDGSGPEPDEALREVMRRFLAMNGPVPSDEVARWWAAVSATRAEKLIRSFGDDVVPIEVEGVSAWALAEHAGAIASVEPARSVRLLPTFDQYVIASTKHSARLMPDGSRDRVHRQAGWVSPVLAVDGRIEGVWKHATTAKRLSVTVEPFRRQPVWVRKGAGAEAERLAAFLDRPLTFEWSA
jgi:uncharacterized protein YcaQ